MGVKIALVGKMRSGKDTFAEPLLEKNRCAGHEFTELKFSRGISFIIHRFFPEVFDTGKPRKYYQQIGQGLRQLDEDVWVKDLQRHYKIYAELGAENFIITDVRQPNEVQWCRDNGFIIVKIEADETTRKERIAACGDIFEPEYFYHETELAVDEIEADIYVNGNVTKEQLQDIALMIFEELKEED